MWYVYVLKSLKNGRHYTGSTNNLNRRIAEHNNGQTKYTSQAGPFELIYKETYNTKLGASRRERFLKSGKGRELLKQILGT
ncbi:MAG: hypothetical protein A3B44_00580 [Candidatus Levybacteria bacterium RIFCSPLOWO2_01_FULL_38_21]|nr:MAG: hypothetical protein A3B44_00580 [Candidatus Levybacteria bacterium RIFCSPLOWO2_01_FULL_38_21]